MLSSQPLSRCSGRRRLSSLGFPFLKASHIERPNVPKCSLQSTERNAMLIGYSASTDLLVLSLQIN